MQVMEFNHYLKNSYGQWCQNKSIEMIDKNRWLLGRGVGMLKPAFLIADIAIQIFQGSKHTFGSVTVDLFRRIGCKIKKVDYKPLYSFSQGMAHYGYGMRFSGDMLVSLFINAISPTIYKETKPVKPPKAVHIDPKVLEDKNKEIEELKKLLAAKTTQKKPKSEKIGKEEAEELKGKIQTLESEKAALEQTSEGLKAQHTKAIEEKHAEMTAATGEKDAQIASLNEQLKALQETANEEHGKEIEALRGEMQLLESEKAALEQASERLKADHSQAVEEGVQLAASKEEKDAQIAALIEQKNAKQALEANNEEIGALRATISVLESEKIVLETECERHQKTISAWSEVRDYLANRPLEPLPTSEASTSKVDDDQMNALKERVLQLERTNEALKRVNYYAFSSSSLRSKDSRPLLERVPSPPLESAPNPPTVPARLIFESSDQPGSVLDPIIPQEEASHMDITTPMGFDRYYDDLMELEEEDRNELLSEATMNLTIKDRMKVIYLLGQKLAPKDENFNISSASLDQPIIPLAPALPPSWNQGIPQAPPPPPPPTVASPSFPAGSSFRPDGSAFSDGRNNLKKTNREKIDEVRKLAESNPFAKAVFAALSKRRTSIEEDKGEPRNINDDEWDAE